MAVLFNYSYRQQRKEVMGQVVKKKLHGRTAEKFIELYCEEKKIDYKDKFTAMALADLGALHAGAIDRRKNISNLQRNDGRRR